ncbi:MAG: hypothetical protein ACREPD_00065 [Stenotrophomonas sp.]|uniref:hypothetical protein n=1 Tax=Stenotrophomonas sp. TaxID=69392 RepID=UPI003D6D6116
MERTGPKRGCTGSGHAALDFNNVRLADAVIRSVVSTGNELRVIYVDWREVEQGLTFRDLAGYQSFSPEGKDLSHGNRVEMDPFIAFACQAAEEEEVEGFRAYSFIAACSGAVILKIVAKDVVICEAGTQA